MKNRRNPLLHAALTIALTGYIGTATNASAQTIRTWTSTSPAGDTGNWSDPTKWSGGDVPDTAGESATFGAYANARTITVDNITYTIDKLTILPRTSGFAGQAFTLNASGGGALSIGSGGLEIGNGLVVSINVPIIVNTAQTWNAVDSPSGSATFSGVISGNGKITRSATGGPGSVFRFNGASTFSGGYEQSAGNAPTTVLGNSTVVTGGSLVSGPLGIGTITLNGGTLRSADTATRTLHNNVVIAGPVTFGNSTQNGALTFTDSGLTTASTFALGSATNGTVNIIRTGNTALNFEQAITETSGTRQGILFSSLSGTPTVTLSRAVTATGNLMTGGVNLVFANNGAISNSVVAVNGSLTATGTNKYSSGSLFSDGAHLIATDASNFSAIAGGKAGVYNNARVSFTTDQTQATVAGLLTSDSQIRLGLGSGNGNATVAENYNQSALGNGRAGLVSASSGIITYNGTLTAGSDNTFRVGGGLGTLALGSSLTGSRALRVEGGGSVTSTVNHSYTGATTITGVNTTLSGTDGAFSATSGITLNDGATLNIATGGTGNNRINNGASLTLNAGSLILNSNTATAAFSETAGDFKVNAGVNSINFRTTPGASTIRTAQFGALTRDNNSLLIVRGDSLGGTATARNEIKFSSAPAMIGGGGVAGTSTQSIIPWMRGVFDGGLASAPGRLVTYDSNGLRTVNPGTEMLQANNNTTARIDQIIATSGGGSQFNVRSIPNTTAGATLVNTAGSTVTLNSLFIDNTAATAANSYSLNSGTVNVTSGVLHIVHGANWNMTVSSGTFAFASAEAIITNNGNGGFLTVLSTTLTGTGGASFYALNGGGISLGSTTNNISGTFTLGGNGFIAVDQDSRFGTSTNSLVHAGGELRFFAGFTSTRGMTLLGNVGDNTLGNNNTNGQTVTWNGDLSGAGRLRLVNNNGASGINGFSLGGGNTYSGGTQIEGINVSTSSNNALGTGTVTLQAGNGNLAGLTLTAVAPTLGGLRGTDGTVTINPTASSSIVTIGSNNESSAFNGVITQATGKTGALTKVGTGNLVLGGNNTYTGGTTVSAGILTVQGSLAGGDVSVAGTLTGSGSIGGATNVASGGVHNSGGIGAVGKQTFTSSLNYSTGSIFAWDLGATPSTTGRGTNYDAVNAASLGAGTGAIFRVVLNGAQDFTSSFWDANRQWTDIFKTSDTGAALNIASIFTGGIQYYNADGAIAGVPLTQGSFSLSGSTLTWSVVPEPTSALAGLLLAAGLLRRRRA